MNENEERKKAIDETYRNYDTAQNMHIMALDKDMNQKYYMVRFCTPRTADRMAIFHAGREGVSCVNIMNDKEYEQYLAQKKAATGTKSSWRISRDNSKV